MEYLTHALAFWLGAAFVLSEAVRIGRSKNGTVVNFLLALAAWPIILYGFAKRVKEKENRP